MKLTLKDFKNFLFSWRKGWLMYLAVWFNTISVSVIYLKNQPDWLTLAITPFVGWVFFSGARATGALKTWDKKEYRNKID